MSLSKIIFADRICASNVQWKVEEWPQKFQEFNLVWKSDHVVFFKLQRPEQKTNFDIFCKSVFYIIPNALCSKICLKHDHESI